MLFVRRLMFSYHGIFENILVGYFNVYGGLKDIEIDIWEFCVLEEE